MSGPDDGQTFVFELNTKTLFHLFGMPVLPRLLDLNKRLLYNHQRSLAENLKASIDKSIEIFEHIFR